jgi:hypothetical protein
MITRILWRSGLQLLGLCVLALFLTTAKVQAAQQECIDQAATCASHCGTTMTWGIAYSFWDPYHHWGWFWDEIDYQWYEGWLGGYTDVYNYDIGSGVEYFECDPGVFSGRGAVCMCRY